MRNHSSRLAVPSILVLLGFLLTIPAQSQNLLGSIDFPTSADEEAHAVFTTGVLLLHSFEYEDAAGAFRAAQDLDPNFALAYWGEAMTLYRPIWNQLFTEDGQAVLARLGATASLRRDKAPTRREKDYLTAIENLFADGDVDKKLQSYRAEMRRIHDVYPDDDEAAVFYALSILGAQRGTRNFAEYMKAAATAEKVFARNPNHPGAAHMLIHSYDDPIHAPLGLRAAEAYSEIAPDASHALHMPSHIFVALGMWDKVADLNERSWKAAENRRIAKDLGKRARSFHAIAWLSYSYLQQGRFQDSAELVESVFHDIEEDGTNGMRSYFVAMKAAFMVNSEQWDKSFPDVDLDELSGRAKVVAAFTSGLSAIKTGDVQSAEQALELIRDLGADDDSAAKRAEIMSAELKALILAESSNFSQAIDLMQQATKAEEEMAFAFGPPSIVKPSHELLGELLLADGRYVEAMEAFEKSLARAPRRALSLRGHALAAAAARDSDIAQSSYSEFQDVREMADTKVVTLEEATREIDE